MKSANPLQSEIALGSGNPDLKSLGGEVEMRVKKSKAKTAWRETSVNKEEEALGAGWLLQKAVCAGFVGPGCRDERRWASRVVRAAETSVQGRRGVDF